MWSLKRDILINADKIDNEILKVLCCPICRSSDIHRNEQVFSCDVCGWKSSLVDGDTISFSPDIYNEPQTRTRRVLKTKSPPKNKPSLRKAIQSRLRPWRQWVFRDIDYWRSAIRPIRSQEMGIVENLLTEIYNGPVDLLLELGVGFQDHVDFYHQFAKSAISSDIYRDPEAVGFYRDLTNVLYCLINIEQMPIRDSSLDLVLTSHVVEHFPDRIRDLKTLHRTLKPDAIACHIVPISTGFLFGHLVGTMVNVLTLTPRIGRGIHGEYDSTWQEIRQTTLGSWRALFQECGFEIIKESPGSLGLTPLRPRLSIWLSKTFRIFGSWIFVMQTLK